MKEKETTTNEIMEFLQEHMVTKEEAKKFAEKTDLRQTEHKIMDALDKKLAELKGKLVSLLRKASKQLDKLVIVLQNKRVLSEKEAEYVLSLNPFPRST